MPCHRLRRDAGNARGERRSRRQPAVSHVRVDEHAGDLGQLVDHLVDAHVRGDTAREGDIAQARAARPMGDVTLHHLLEVDLHACGEVFPAPAVGQRLLQSPDRLQEHTSPAILEAAIHLVDEASQQVDVDRLAIGGEPGDLPLVLHRLESTDMCHIGVVVAQRVIGGDVVELLPAPAAHGVDQRRAPVSAAVHRHHQSVLEAAREIRRSDMAQVVIHELDRAADLELLAQDLLDPSASSGKARLEQCVVAALEQRDPGSQGRELPRHSLDRAHRAARVMLEPALESLQLVLQQVGGRGHHHAIEIAGAAGGLRQHVADRTAREALDEFHAADALFVHRRQDAAVLDERGARIAARPDPENPHRWPSPDSSCCACAAQSTSRAPLGNYS